MATSGIIIQLVGNVVAIDATGKERVVQVGDEVVLGEVIKTIGESSKVTISTNDDKDITLLGNDTLSFDNSVTQVQSFGDDAIADASSLQQAILSGADLTQLEETAAGGDSAAGDGGEGTGQLNDSVFAQGGHESNVHADYGDLGNIATVAALNNINGVDGGRSTNTDITPPVVNISSITSIDTATNADGKPNVLKIIGTSDTPNSVVVFKDSDGKEIGRGKTDNEGNFDSTIGFTDGPITAEITDLSGNIGSDTDSTNSDIVFTDKTPPEAPRIEFIEDNKKIDGIINIDENGTSKDKTTANIIIPNGVVAGDTLRVTVNGETKDITLTSDDIVNGYKVEVDINGNKSVSATIIDQANNKSITKTETIAVDLEAPKFSNIQITQIDTDASADSKANTTRVTFNVDDPAAQSVYVVVDDKSYIAHKLADGSYIVEIDALKAGTKIDIQATDPAGNTGKASSDISNDNSLTVPEGINEFSDNTLPSVAIVKFLEDVYEDNGLLSSKEAKGGNYDNKEEGLAADKHYTTLGVEVPAGIVEGDNLTVTIVKNNGKDQVIETYNLTIKDGKAVDVNGKEYKIETIAESFSDSGTPVSKVNYVVINDILVSDNQKVVAKAYYTDQAGLKGGVGQDELVADFTNEVTISVVDDKGNAPTELDIKDKPQITNDANPTIEGITDPGSKVQLFIDGKKVGDPVEVREDGKYKFTPKLEDGPHNIIVESIDPAGNVAKKDVDLVVDTKAPDVTIEQIAGKDFNSNTTTVTNDTTPSIKVKVEKGSTPKLVDSEGKDIPTTVVDNKDGTFTITPDSPVEPNSVNIVVEDEAGNTTKTKVPLSFDINVEIEETTPAKEGAKSATYTVSAPDITEKTTLTVTFGEGDHVVTKDVVVEPNKKVTVKLNESEINTLKPDNLYNEANDSIKVAVAEKTPTKGVTFKGDKSTVTMVDDVDTTKFEFEVTTKTVITYDNYTNVAGVTVTAEKVDGTTGNIVKVEQAEQNGIGVEGDTSGTADTRELGTSKDGKSSEKIIVKLDGEAESVTIITSWLHQGEKGHIKFLDRNGHVVGESEIKGDNDKIGEDRDFAPKSGLKFSTIEFTAKGFDSDYLLNKIALNNFVMDSDVNTSGKDISSREIEIKFDLDPKNPSEVDDTTFKNTTVVLTINGKEYKNVNINPDGTATLTVKQSEASNLLDNQGNFKVDVKIDKINGNFEKLEFDLATDGNTSINPNDSKVIPAPTITFLEDKDNNNYLNKEENGDNSADTPVRISIPEGSKVGDILRTYENGKESETEITQKMIDDKYHDITVLVNDRQKTDVSAYVIDSKTGSAGKQATASIDVDLTSPDVPKITSIIDDVEGITGDIEIKTGQTITTNDLAPIIKGIAEANSTVKVYAGEKLIGITTADAKGKFELPVKEGEFTDGQKYDITATSEDVAGNVSQKSNIVSVEIDTIAPDAPTSIAEKDDGVVVGLPENAKVGDKVELIIDGETKTKTITETDFDNKEITFEDALFGKGTEEVIAKIVDQAGNPSEPKIETLNNNYEVSITPNESVTEGTLTYTLTTARPVDKNTTFNVKFVNGDKEVFRDVVVGQGSNKAEIQLDDSEVNKIAPDDFYKQGERNVSVTVEAADGRNVELKTDTIKVVDDTDALKATITGNIEVYDTVITVENVDSFPGISITAQHPNGSKANISKVTNMDHPGFGVEGKTRIGENNEQYNADDNELGRSETGSEAILVKFQGKVDSADVKFAWLASNEKAQVDLLDKEGNTIETIIIDGNSDMVDAHEIQSKNGAKFSGMKFTAPEPTQGTGNDYLINEIKVNNFVIDKNAKIATEYLEKKYVVKLEVELKPADGSKVTDGAIKDGTKVTVDVNGKEITSDKIVNENGKFIAKIDYPVKAEDIDEKGNLKIDAKVISVNNPEGVEFEKPVVINNEDGQEAQWSDSKDNVVNVKQGVEITAENDHINEAGTETYTLNFNNPLEVNSKVKVEFSSNGEKYSKEISVLEGELSNNKTTLKFTLTNDELQKLRADDNYKQADQNLVIDKVSIKNGDSEYKDIEAIISKPTVVIGDDSDVVSVTLDGIITKSTSITVDAVIDKKVEGITLTAEGPYGESANISTVKDTDHDGFGVEGITSRYYDKTDSDGGADSKELGYLADTGSEKIILTLKDNQADSIQAKFAWKNSQESAKIEFYRGDELVGEQTITGEKSNDRVDETRILRPEGKDNNTFFDKVVFSAPNKGDDYLINEIRVNTITINKDVNITKEIIKENGDDVILTVKTSVPPQAGYPATAVIDLGNNLTKEVALDEKGEGIVKVKLSDIHKEANDKDFIINAKVIEIKGGNFEDIDLKNAKWNETKHILDSENNKEESSVEKETDGKENVSQSTDNDQNDNDSVHKEIYIDSKYNGLSGEAYLYRSSTSSGHANHVFEATKDGSRNKIAWKGGDVSDEKYISNAEYYLRDPEKVGIKSNASFTIDKLEANHGNNRNYHKDLISGLKEQSHIKNFTSHEHPTKEYGQDTIFKYSGTFLTAGHNNKMFMDFGQTNGLAVVKIDGQVVSRFSSNGKYGFNIFNWQGKLHNEFDVKLDAGQHKIEVIIAQSGSKSTTPVKVGFVAPDETRVPLGEEHTGLDIKVYNDDFIVPENAHYDADTNSYVYNGALDEHASSIVSHPQPRMASSHGSENDYEQIDSEFLDDVQKTDAKSFVATNTLLSNVDDGSVDLSKLDSIKNDDKPIKPIIDEVKSIHVGLDDDKNSLDTVLPETKEVQDLKAEVSEISPASELTLEQKVENLLSNKTQKTISTTHSDTDVGGVDNVQPLQEVNSVDEFVNKH
ncbi:hypothetical protein CPIN18020_1642 [Campylobacter pinnipediorum subsp. caledonicus]|uniref:retention module-containing protein n=1 Tax=Campylobacter pinnipediorum TaxID=1965231 RepID=UPI00099511A5|nr:retention module-containing protein [Campylobacter pinnipediorum]AQW86819.1 hypothetical protein CPIN18020_1642 [Campylobacter pinnipediorum subsp. caledonicus]